ncbi:serine/threonine-protein phosphatase 6 regulatory ankyrin repeat subunit C-like [Mercenaria mercenaria]|uniref:serine/threonine-protein phosphatase 6 regulatory ankyrin repeat subunit C-like n=1 Tax=Mercenaria mercenaria TaxID=6596 RepID=UPI00234E660E|nr:serine/threonine-protein phosphatase 6 regulatory ankyrin repeat subunit C-like [Mercenaria mercenaria]
MERVSINESSRDKFKVTLKEGKMRCLAEKCTNMILRRDCNEVVETPDVDEFQMLQRWGQRSNVIKVVNKIDFGIIKHKAFRSTKFVNEFIDHVVEINLVRDVFSVPVMTMKGYFLDYGILKQKFDMCLTGYAWYSGTSVFAKEVIRREIMEMENFDPSVSLLLAAHSTQRESVQFLLENGAKVTGDVIYIAAHKSVEVLEMVLQRPGVDVNDRGDAINGNYPLIAAARNGLHEAVMCMLTFGADTGVQNNAKMTALHKAILHQHAEIIEELFEAGAPLDVRGGKYKRTPLHLAVDLGNEDLVNQLINKGASLQIKDNRGQYPIHMAAIQDNVKIVKRLYLFDKTQETLRISSYGKKSMIKGMSLFHVAIWKKNVRLLAALIRMEINPNIQDFYGQTPLFFAIMKRHANLAKKLLDYHKTDKTKSQKQGYTPLNAAIHKELPEVATKLIGLSDVNVVDRFGKTPLHVACDKMNTVLIKKLLENGADPRQITKRGDTIFHLLKRKKNRTPLNKIEESKYAEMLLAEWDPEFVKLLPGLKNKTGEVIKLHYHPTGLITRKQLLLAKPVSSNMGAGNTSEDENYSSGEGSFGDTFGEMDNDDDDDDDEDDYDDDNDDVDMG